MISHQKMYYFYNESTEKVMTFMDFMNLMNFMNFMNFLNGIFTICLNLLKQIFPMMVFQKTTLELHPISVPSVNPMTIAQTIEYVQELVQDQLIHSKNDYRFQNILEKIVETMVIFYHIDGNLSGVKHKKGKNNKVLFLKGFSRALGFHFEIHIQKSLIRPKLLTIEPYNEWSEAYYYIEHTDYNKNSKKFEQCFYLINCTIGGGQYKQSSPQIKLNYWEIGLPALVYGSIMGTLAYRI